MSWNQEKRETMLHIDVAAAMKAIHTIGITECVRDGIIMMVVAAGVMITTMAGRCFAAIRVDADVVNMGIIQAGDFAGISFPKMR
jgi:transketolase C-terminal domain/subunit